MKTFGSMKNDYDIVNLKSHNSRLFEMFGGYKPLVINESVMLENLIVNGDFSDGLNHWHSMTDIVDGNPTGSFRFYQLTMDKITEGSTYYIRAKIKSTSNLINIGFNGETVEFSNYDHDWKEISLVTSKIGNGNLMFAGSQGTTYEIDSDYGITLTNLTKSFGAGKEPTKEQMDRLINYLGYFNGSKTVNIGRFI